MNPVIHTVVVLVETSRVECLVGVRVERRRSGRWDAELPQPGNGEPGAFGTGESAELAATTCLEALYAALHRSEERVSQWLLTYDKSFGQTEVAA